MKNRRFIKVSLLDLAWIILPLLIWVGLIQSRGIWVKPYCNESPALCAEKTVSWPDRISLHIENSFANQLSFMTQNASGAVAASAILLFHATQAASAVISPSIVLAQVGVDLLILVETTLWNGASLEVARTAVQRPRPFVYKDPEGLGENPSHYTSFYSGHTSFSAAILMVSLLILIYRKASRSWISILAATSSLLVFSTALLRVLAGRHFITDVLGGLVFGVLTALAVFFIHLRKSQTTPNEMSPKKT